MQLRNRFSTNTDGESEALPRSTRRRFLRYLGVGAASTALVSGAQALSPVAALAATHKGATSIAQFSPTGSASGVNVVLVHGIWADGSSYSRIIPLLLAAGHTVFAVQLPLTTHMVDDVTATLGCLGNCRGQRCWWGTPMGEPSSPTRAPVNPTSPAWSTPRLSRPTWERCLANFPQGRGRPICTR